jgi:N-acetylglucosaminyl-diphospho-decaprenol L-rhamnosyltransferase
MGMAPAQRGTGSGADRGGADAAVDVVIVSYNSRDHLRSAVMRLLDSETVRIVVVDNASQDGSLRTVTDLAVKRMGLAVNRGFAAGSNAGWRMGRAPYVLFLNPDARIEQHSVRVLVDVLERNERAGLVAPRIVDSSGLLDYSQRRFPRLRSTYSTAFFLHRMMPRASWTDEVVRDPDSYATARTCDWVSGACMLVRRDLLEALGGFDEDFFLYCEDQDLCKRVQDAGYEVRFEPRAVAVHYGGASAPRPSLFSLAARSRLLYARKHSPRGAAVLQWLGLVVGALTHSLVSRGGLRSRIGHLRAFLAIALRPRAAG